MIGKMSKLIQAFILCIVASGCSHTITPRPDTFKLNPEPQFTSPVAISIINTQTDNVDRVYLEARNHSFAGNKKAWTDTAVEITKQELTARQATVLDGEQRKLELSIISIEADFLWRGVYNRSNYRLKLKVKTGSGYENTYAGNNGSPAGHVRAADGAVMRAVALMFSDPDIIKYITSTEVLTGDEPDEHGVSPFESLEKLN